MRKITWTIAIILCLSSITALAASTTFLDEGNFADWFSSSVKKMQYNGIIEGYPDGTFKPENNVNRAELAVILDRYSEATGNELNEGPLICTEEYVYGLNIHLQNQQGNPITEANITTNEYDGNFEEWQNGIYLGLGEAETGYYTFTINKEGYNEHIETVKLESTRCHVIPQTKTITLVQQSSV